MWGLSVIFGYLFEMEGFEKLHYNSEELQNNFISIYQVMAILLFLIYTNSNKFRVYFYNNGSL